MKRIERVALYPTRRQEQVLLFMLDVLRQLYNAALEQRREAWRRGIRVTNRMQYAELTALRQEVSSLGLRLAKGYRESEDAVLHRLDLAFAAFFRRLRTGEKPGYPRFKPASRWNQIEFPHGNRALRLDASQTRVTIPGVGTVKLRKGRTIPLNYGRAWLVRRNDRWYACFECEREVQPLPAAARPLVAVDRGIHVLAALDHGKLIRNLAVGEKRRRGTARLQRELEAVTVRDAAGRVRNGSDLHRIAAAKRLARAKEREANARRDYAHKEARKIVNDAEIVALEELNLRAMTRSAKGTVEQPGRNVAAKAGLNRRLLDSGFGLLARLIAEKAEEAARRLVWVDPRFSSQECSRCEHRAKGSRRRRRFICVACGFTVHADVNAALVIRRRAELELMSVLSVGPGPVTRHDAV